MHGKSRRTAAITSALAITLSCIASAALWFHSRSTPLLLQSPQLLTFLIQAMIVVPVLVVTVALSFRYAAKKAQADLQAMELRKKLDRQNAELAAAHFQSEQVNRQLQLSVSHANVITQQAVESNRAKGEFLAAMSHQIRTPMNAIIGFSEMLAEDNLDAEQKKQIRIIRDSSRHLFQLINDILDFSKIEAGNLELEMTEITIDSILSSVESLIKPAAVGKGLQFEIIKNQPLPMFIRTDPSRFKQCLQNLVANAVRFTHKGFVRITVSGERQDEKGFARFDVEDSGAGIIADKLERVFEPFAQIDSASITRPHGSTGLGMTITKHIVELLGGKITAQSNYGKGSTFSLFIPAAIETGRHENHKKAPSADEDAPAKANNANVKFKGSVLIVEDSPTNQMLIDLLLKKLGIQTDLAQNGLEAVQKTNKRRYDVILMDMLMPVMNGYEATRQIKIKGIDTPIIALTACAMKGDDEKCFAAGCDAYLTKPTDRKKLVETLAKYLPAEGEKQPSQTVENNTEQTKEPIMQTPDTNPADQTQLEVDWQLLMERIGDEELIDEIVPIFLKDNKERMVLLEQAVQKNDSKEVKFFAHSIKGASGAIGASAIFELGKELEYAAREEQTEKYAPLFAGIKSHFANLLAFLDNKDWKEIAKAAAESHKSS
ncbi:MAG: hypothetical protein CVV39_04165 [Planctomycetes bacterium HGW-Planctomycetes-1]|nr:MAG: hypothetical protein CVV39_04165 [Planctomycetes bacterium HGW-Planctomycetes-1]